MTRTSITPVALTIAGSDSGGGAGIQADLKTFAAIGVHGTSAVTCLTAQNPRRVTDIQAARPSMVRNQIEAVFEELKPAAAKTGMLFSTAIIDEVVRCWKRLGRGVPLVVDPVMAATSGALLLKPAAVRAVLERLLPIASLASPNLDEVEIILGWRPDDPEGMRTAAKEIHDRFGCAALVKGGHLRGMKEAVDIFWDGRNELLLTAPFLRGLSTHGSGCTYSAAVAGHLARGARLPEAVARAKDFITAAVRNSLRLKRHTALNPR